MGATAIGVGLALGGSKESTLVGAIAGGIVGLSSVTVANAQSSPATSNASRDVLDAAFKAMQVRAEAENAARTPATTAGDRDAAPKKLSATPRRRRRGNAPEAPIATAKRGLSPAKRGTK
jgi:hypothetical protein